jgi:hypothetical protein
VLNVEQAQSFLQPILTKSNRGGNLQHPKLATPSEARQPSLPYPPRFANRETIAREFAEEFNNTKPSAGYNVRHNPCR